MTLTVDSPAIDAGIAAHCPAGDYLGATRPVDGDGDGKPICDMGAYEWGAVVPTPEPMTEFIYLPLVVDGVQHGRYLNPASAFKTPSLLGRMN